MRTRRDRIERADRRGELGGACEPLPRLLREAAQYEAIDARQDLLAGDLLLAAPPRREQLPAERQDRKQREPEEQARPDHLRLPNSPAAGGHCASTHASRWPVIMPPVSRD